MRRENAREVEGERPQGASPVLRQGPASPGKSTLVERSPASGGVPPVQRKPSDKPEAKPTKDDVPQLPDGVNLKVLADGMVIVRSTWIEEAPDMSKSRVKCPSRIAEILRALKSSRVLHWLPDDKIEIYANTLQFETPINSKAQKFVRVPIAFSTYTLIGPPPGINVMFQRDGRGITGILRQSTAIPGPVTEVAEVQLSDAVRKEIWTALEKFTGMTIDRAVKDALIKSSPLKVHTSPGNQGLLLGFGADLLAQVYGQKKWSDHVANPGPVEQGSGVISGPGGIKFSAEVPEEDRQYYLDWLKQLKGGGGKPTEVFVSPSLIEKLRQLDADPDLKAKVLAKLQAGGGGDGRGLDSTTIDNLINAVRTDDARKQLGVPDGNLPYKPIFEQPVTGSIINRGGVNYVGQDTAFYFETRNRMDAFAVPLVEAQWVVTPKDKPTEHVAEGRTSHVEFREPDTFSVAWKDKGIYTVHAFVTHTYYQPSHFQIDVDVKTEKERTEELNDPAFKGLQGPTTGQDDHHGFDVSWFNSAFGSDKEQYGKKTWGMTPEDFQRMPYEQRVAFIAQDKQQLKDLIAANTNARGEPLSAAAADLVSFAKSKLASLEETEKMLGKENQDGNTFFEARGTFLSRKNGIPSKALKLVASAKKDGSAIKTLVHDFTQLSEPMDYTFSALGATFDKSIEATFVDLAKTYPAGRISCLFEALDDELAPNKRTVGFELDTGTAWKDVKSVAYNPGVMIAVNIVGAATMVFAPVTAPVLFPILATYNSIETIDSMAELSAKGNLTWGSVGKGVAQIGLNFLPYVGKVKAIANLGKTAMYTLEGFQLAGMTVLMTADGVEQVRRLHDRDISEIAKLDAQVRELERTNPSDPQLPALRAQRDEMIEQARARATEVIESMAKQGAVMLVQMGALKGLDTHLKNTSIQNLKSQGLYEHVDGVEPHYDAKTGQIRGDETKLDRGKLAQLQDQFAADMAGKQRELANVLGTDDVDLVRGGNQVRVTREGDRYKVELPNNRPFSDAIDEAWNTRRKLDPKAPSERPAPVVADITPVVDPQALVTRRNVAVGSSVQTESEAHQILGKLASGDRTAFKALGIEPPPREFDLRSVEWGIGQRPDGSFIIIRGEPGAVNWNGFAGIRPVAHSHPLNENKLLPRAVSISDLIAGGGEMEVNKVNVFPSAADVRFCVEQGVTEHTVQTPYVSKGGGKIGNPAPGGKEPLVQFKILQPERAGSWAGNDELGVFKSHMVATDAGGKVLWKGDVWSADHPGIGSVLMFEEPPSALMTKKIAGATPGATTTRTTSTNSGDPTKTRWVTDLPGKLTPEEQRRLDLMTKDKAPAEVYDMFGGDLEFAKARLAGSNLTPELFHRRAQLSPKAQRAFDEKWNAMIGDERNPSAARIKAFEGYLAAMQKRGGNLDAGLVAEEGKIAPGKVVGAPQAADYPASWKAWFKPEYNAEFKTRLEELRGNEFMEPNYTGGEGAVFLGESKSTALKRWFGSRFTDFAASVALLREAHAAVTGNSALSKYIDVVEVHQVGSDWILRDFRLDSGKVSGFTSGAPEVARQAAIDALKAKPSLSGVERSILSKLENRSDNVHWDIQRGKLVIIDMK